ncbi:TerC family protein [Myxococcota bacterium]|nr:TerC family protein [Myxococcota bacterium]
MEFLEIFTSAEMWISLATLAALEIVLGIDNIVFITILASKLPPEEQMKARRLGLGFALFTRILLLLGIKWVMEWTVPLFSVFSHSFSGRDLILLTGGLFLIAKSSHEIYEKMEVEEEETGGPKGAKVLWLLVAQIMLLDIVFSLDSVITAVGMADEIGVMIAAMVIAVIVMMLFANVVGDFVERHPSMKILALSFLLLIGVLLLTEGLGEHVNKGYIYFAMSFSLLVEMVNMRVRKVTKKKVTASASS